MKKSVKMNDAMLALEVEKRFNKKNQLLVTYHENDSLKNSLKTLHPAIKNVYSLKPVYVPKQRFLIEVEDKLKANFLKTSLPKKALEAGSLTVDFVRKLEVDTSKPYIDPYTLYVQNLPLNVKNKDIEILYPSCDKYKILEIRSSNDESKSCLVHFKTTQEAIIAYKSTNNVSYNSNCLIIQFNRNKFKLNAPDTIEITDDVVEFVMHDEGDWSEEDQYNEEDAVYYENNCLRDNNEKMQNKQMKSTVITSDTILLKNLPISITDIELFNLFPNCFEYNITLDNSRQSKIAHVRFATVEDAVKCYSKVNNMIYKSRVLNVEYFHNNNNNNASRDKFVFNSNVKTKLLQVEMKKEHIEVIDLNQPEPEQDQVQVGVKKEQKTEYVVDEQQKIADLKLVQSILSKLDKKMEDYKINPYVLHIKNLPANINYQVIYKLYPACYKYKTFREATAAPRTSSALIYFKNVQDSIHAYKTTRTMHYKSKYLSVKFKCENLLVNPLAKRKLDTNDLDNFKLMKRSTDQDECKIVFVQGTALNEDDIDLKSEPESDNNDEDCFRYEDVDDCAETEDIFNEDGTEDEEECQELDVNETFLPQDEDMF